MSSTVNIEKRTAVHKTSGGMVTSFPDVCKTPQPSGPPVPIPYPNIAMSQDTSMGSKTVKVDGHPVNLKDSNFSRSMGDEPGTLKGITSNTNMDKLKWKKYSSKVKFEGKGVVRLFDLAVNNVGMSGNTPPFPVVQPPIVVMGAAETLEPDNEGWELTSVQEAAQ